MATAFDAVGPSAAGTSSTSSTNLSWTHTVGAGATNPIIVVAVALDPTGADTGITMSATCATVPMTTITPIVESFSASSTGGYLQVWWTPVPVSTGSNAIVVSVAGGTPKDLTGGSLSFTSAAMMQPGSAYILQGTGSVSIPVTASTTNNTIAGFLGAGDAIGASSNTAQFSNNLQGTSGNLMGNIAGSTAPGNSSGTVNIVWANGGTYGGLAVEIQSMPLSVKTLTVPSATYNLPYSFTLTAGGGTGTGYTWSVISGALPTGLTLTGTGSNTISGTPTASGYFTFTVQVTDSGSNTATQALSMWVYVYEGASFSDAVPAQIIPGFIPGIPPVVTAPPVLVTTMTRGISMWR